ncbi:integrase core domain-containing protein [Tropicimonas sp. IMCC34043]|uniref:integrase core domain-containing protein n=1 Tax=Tropicimonas sp. IMCC34043 TaxID=2248760 RepID=UPI000E289D81|nr:integrase core domain-containing protein [Tropicimonas sp. IMCC34043]
MPSRLFSSLTEAREQIRAWQHDDNHRRPHSGIGNIPPVEFVAKRGLAMRAA